MRAHHEGLFDLHAGTLACLQQLNRLLCIERDRFFAEHVLPGFCRFDGPRHMQMIRKRIVDGLDGPVGEQLVI